MNTKDKLLIFEKMYLQEEEAKDKITVRVQIVFTLIVAVIAVSSYILRMLDFSEYPVVSGVIISLVVLYSALLSIACFYAVRAFWGYTFASVPSAAKVGDYCRKMTVYDADLRAAGEAGLDVKDEIEVFLSNAYEVSAAHNYDINKLRAGRVHLSFRFFLLSLAPLLCAGVLFIGFDMDTSSARKNYQVIDRYVGDQLGKLEQRLEVIAENTNEMKEVMVSNSKDDSNKGVTENKLSEPVSQIGSPPPLNAIPRRPEAPPVVFVMNMMSKGSLEKFSKSHKGESDEPSEK